MDVYMLCTSRNAYPLMDLLARVVLFLIHIGVGFGVARSD